MTANISRRTLLTATGSLAVLGATSAYDVRRKTSPR